MSQAAPCVFCGRSGSSKEDVFPKWVVDVLKGEGPFTLTRKQGRGKTNLRYLGLTSRAPCRKCNNEWMSGLETAAKPLLTPIIRDEPIRWTGTDRERVAAWIFKTALMIDRSSRPENWTTPDRDFGYLFQHRKPPASLTIHLARYVSNPGETNFAAWAGSSWAFAKSATGQEIKGYRVTFSIGYAIFQTYGHISPDSQPIIYEPRIFVGDAIVSDLWRRLWPLDPEPHEWPPRGGQFATSGLQLLEPVEP